MNKKKKWLNEENLKSLVDAVNGNMASFATAVTATFAEVYENMDELETQLSYSYDPEKEMLTVPSKRGMVSGETLYLL